MFKRYISLQLAANILLVALGALVVFHLLVISGIINPGMIWGGNLETNSQVVMMEIGAIVVSALMMLMIAIRVGYIQSPRFQGFSQTAMWVIFVFLLLNTAGNLSSSSGSETLIFTPITIILAVMAYRLAMQDGKA
ncbi:hypothetical protein [Flavilitoribacter nigricans]|uniref:Uncharacterized protein n=1 Tax=Flavilitoribacter nigricans (strain ATCC 23147 / DSM 23189 / NBRC 102662 / NCIMB 1420 / SS-2) TaxID=1122177 RepID=A0A2D0N345_FLAN2|nr:hypothetical protein [Flavilitoribacter nigricans]PHN02818.1 hypothetical protein CRP01_30010 [Flavilitoribacter nigricans DSM 23189 = NBRC 102662]